MPELEKDPLDDVEADYNVDLTKFKGYQLESQGTFLNPSKDKVQVSDGAMKQISHFQKKFREKRERRKSEAEVAERKASMEERRASFDESEKVLGVKTGDTGLEPVKEESASPEKIPERNLDDLEHPKDSKAEPTVVPDIKIDTEAKLVAPEKELLVVCSSPEPKVAEEPKPVEKKN